MTEHTPIMTLRECIDAEEPSLPMRSDASRAEIVCGLPSCRTPFKPKRPWQRYCCDAHRREANKLQSDGGLRGVVKSTRILKGGGVSVTLHFGSDEREGALQLAPGRVMEVL